MPADVDAIVIGAGVVGLAIGRALAESGCDTLVVEHHRQVGQESSSRNSGVIHAGIYYEADSLKARLCVRGKQLLYDYAAAKNIAHKRCGKLLIAADAQLAHLRDLHTKALRNGVQELQWLSAAEVAELEPEVHCAAGVHSQSTGIIDPHELMTALLGDLESAGGMVVLNTIVRRVRPVSEGIELEFENDGEVGTIVARSVVNAAGLAAVALSHQIEGYPREQIPRGYFARGSYFSYPGRPFQRLVYPMPTEAGLGIHATPDLSGDIRFGPDVEWIDEIDYGVDPTRAHFFAAAIREYWPAVTAERLKPSFAGIRSKIAGPGEKARDFMIAGHETHGIAGLVNLLGIESPGLTACLAIGELVCTMLSSSEGTRPQT